jgi:hypothetical protein
MIKIKILIKIIKIINFQWNPKYELLEKNVLIEEALSDINKKWSHAFWLSLTEVYKFLQKKYILEMKW